MKKILSVVLSIVLAMGTLPVAYASGISINNWNGFTGDGVTVTNPDPAADSDDDVIKLSAGEVTTLSLEESVSGNVLITFDFYAGAEQNSAISALATNGSVIGSFALKDDGTIGDSDTYRTGKWQTAKMLIYPDGKISRTYIGDAYIGEEVIETASLSLKSIYFEAGGELYINNINVYNYTTPVYDASRLIEVTSSNEAAVVTAAAPSELAAEFENALIEAKIDASELGEGALKLVLTTDNALNPTVLELDSTTVPEGEFDVKANVNMDAQTVDVYVNKTKLEVPVSLLAADGTAATKVSKIAFEVTGEGSATIKSVSVKEPDPIKYHEGQSDKTLYEENFDNDEAKVGSGVPYFDKNGSYEKMAASFTTVDATTGHSTSKVGMLKHQHYNSKYYSGYRFNDDGTPDENAEGFTSGTNATWFSRDLSSKTSGIDNITLSFKYYNAHNATQYDDGSGISRERLYAGFGTGSGLGNMTGANSIAYYVNQGQQKVELYVNGAKKQAGSVVWSTIGKKWVDAKLIIKENADGTATATVVGPKSSDLTEGEESFTLDSFPEISNLSFQMDVVYGGKYYLDDIKVTTVVTRDADEYYTEDEFMDISSAVTTSAYTNDITRGEEAIDTDLPEDTVSTTMTNPKTTFYSNDFSTMGIYGFDASENIEASTVYADGMGSVMSLAPADSASAGKVVYEIGSITDVWDGTVDTSWYNASAQTYEIWSGADLAGLAKLVNDNTADFAGKTVKLMCNIDLDDKNWTPIGTGAEIASKVYNGFKGTFDGNGNEIRNLKITDTVKASESSARYFALFGYANGTIKNVGVRGAKVIITAEGLKQLFISGLAGSFTGSMENCYVIGAEIKGVRDEEVEKTIKKIGDGGTWTWSADRVAPLAGQAGTSTTINGCYVRDVMIYASWHALSAGLVGYCSGTKGKVTNINNCYVAAPFTFTTNPATGERGRFYWVSSKGESSYNLESGNYYTDAVEQYRGQGNGSDIPAGETTKYVYGNGFSAFESGTVGTLQSLKAALETHSLYCEDIYRVNDSYPILKTQKTPVDSDMNVAFEAMVPEGSDADLVLYSGNEVAATISLTEIAGNAWKAIDLAFRNGTYIPVIDGVTGEAVELESSNDGISKFEIVVNEGTAYVENVLIYKDSSDIFAQAFAKLYNEIAAQMENYPVLENNLTLPETVDGYAVTWESSDKNYLDNEGVITSQKNCTVPVSLTATVTLDRVSAAYNSAVGQVTFMFDLAPVEGADDEATVDAIIEDLLMSDYITEESRDAISHDLNNLPTEWDGATIEWSTSDDTVMDADGKITIAETETKEVTLTATVVLGEVEKSTDLTFTVLSYDRLLADAQAAIDYTTINGSDGNEVSKNLTLPDTGLYGTSITWVSDDESLVTNRGFLMEITQNEYVTMTATIERDGYTVTDEFQFVTRISPNVKIAADMEKVSVQETTEADITVPVTGEVYDSAITWTSNSNYAVVDGAKIKVTRPENNVGDATVTLTAKFAVDGVSVSKDYTLIVTSLPADDVLINAQLEEIDFTDISDESDTAVTNNLHLVTYFPYNIGCEWTSSNTDVVTDDGIVTRPAIGEDDEEVTMTLKLIRGEADGTDEITFIVKAFETTEEVLEQAKALLTFRALSGDPINLVANDLTLPKEWKFGTEISWASDNAMIAVEEGEDGNYVGKITRPAYASDNTPVNLTATISYNGQSVTKSFTVTLAEEHGYEALYYADFDSLTVGSNYTIDKSGIGAGQYEHNQGNQLSVVADDPAGVAGNNVLKISKTPDMKDDTTSSTKWMFFRTNANSRRNGILRIQQDVYVEAMSNLRLRIVGSIGGGNDGNIEEVNVFIDHEGNLYQKTSTYMATKKFEFGKWNNLIIEFNSYEETLDVYLNNELVLEDAPFHYQYDGTNLTAVKYKFEAGTDKNGLANETHVLYMDNICALRKVDYAAEMAAAMNELEAGFLAAQDINAITDTVKVPTLSAYEYDIDVTTTSSNTAVVAHNGAVSRPNKDTEVEYTITLSNEFGAVRSRTFKLLVKSAGYTGEESGVTLTDEQKATQDAEGAITELKKNHTLSYVTGNLTLPSSAENGSTITWKSLNTSVITNGGTVTRPTTDTKVTLTCTATLNGTSVQKTVEVTVKAKADEPQGGAVSSTPSTPTGVMPYAPSVVPSEGEDNTGTKDDTSFVFDDVKEHWAEDYIMELYEAGVINGVSDTEFAPNDSISREAFLTMLIRALGNELDTDYEEVFDDVKTTDWYYQYVMEGYKMGIVNGTSSVSFGTGANISRQDLCTMIARALESKGIEMDTEAISEFADSIMIEDYAKDAIYGLKNLGIIDGKDNNYFDPRGIATRAEAAKIMSGLIGVLSIEE